MRLVSFVDRIVDDAGRPADDPGRPGDGPGGARTGVVVGDEVVDLTDPAVGLPGDMADLLAGRDGALGAAARAADTRARRLPLAMVRLLAPVPRPAKVMGLGMNYGAHVAEMGRPRPEHQVWFNKQRTCVIAPLDAIEVPRASDQVDYEGELAFVIGRRCRHVPASDAASVIAGFTVMNDVSVRDWQWRAPTWTMGKSFDTHGPLGPWIVTSDEVPEPHDLRLRTWVNGELRQDSSTDDMIFSCGEMVEELSTVFTLEPGDVVSTGTPAGVGASFDPPRWLVAGDSVRIEVEGVGVLENPVVDERIP
jgi:2-keto-4-pentenoate hydratase/2-oxohepta-3-ene-1,7-dioic acid hydratase in catechol pathway